MWTADRTPLIADGMRMVPSGSNRFKKSEAPALYAEIYEPLLVGADSNKTALTVGLAIRIIDRKTGEQQLDTGLINVTLPPAASSPGHPDCETHSYRFTSTGLLPRGARSER